MRTSRWTALGLLILLVGIGLAVLSRYWRPDKVEGHLMEVRVIRKLKAIGMALAQYEAIHGRFPPACLLDDNGKPIHSWRVLLLPYMGEDARSVYERYDFNEPWDGPNNLALAAEIPDDYRSPFNEAADTPTTCFVAVTGERTMWRAGQGVARDEITDGTAVTVGVVVAEPGVKWTEPRDMTFSEAMRTGARDNELSIKFFGTGNSPCLTACGGVASLNESMSQDDLKAVLTINGGERAGRVLADGWRPPDK